MNPFSLFMLSIVIVSYNSSHIISACLESIIADARDFELQVIIVDNKSTDNTVSEIEDFISDNIRDNIRFELIKNSTNLGFTKALNQGLSRVQKNYVIILNPDVILIKDFFKKMISFLNENQDTGIIAPQHSDKDGYILPSCRNFPDYKTLLYEFSLLSYIFKKSTTFNSWKMGYFDHKTQREVSQPMGACLVTTKDILGKIGDFDEDFTMFFSDVDWCYRVHKAALKIIFYPEARIIHFSGHSVKQRKYRMIVQSHKDFYLYYKKYYNNKIAHFLIWALLKLIIPIRFIIVFIQRLFKWL